MSGVRARGEEIRRYLIDNIEKHPADITKRTAHHFDITRQAISKHLRRLIEEKVIALSGKTRARIYKLCATTEWNRGYRITSALSESG